MSATLHAIKNAATTTIKTGTDEAPLWFQIRKVRTSDVAQLGVAALAMMNPKNAPNPNKKNDDDAQDIEKLLSRLSPKQVGELTEMQAAIACAGVMGISADGDNFEPVDLVMSSKEEDVDNGRLCVHSLPPGIVETCFAEILELSTDKGGSAARLATFLGSEESAPLDDARHTGKKVRKNTRRASRQ